MGLVYNEIEAAGWIRDYNEESVDITEALIMPGQDSVSISVEKMSEDEVRRLALKLDILANSRQNETIAAMVAKAFPSIRDLVRWVKTETKEEFRGMKAAGGQLDIVWLRPEDVGGSLLNPAGTSNKGLYGGTSGGVYTWLNSFTAGTSDDMIPAQKMAEEAGVIHLGIADPAPLMDETVKVNRIKFTLESTPAPTQALALNFTDGSELPVQEFEYPVMVGPEKTQQIDIDPFITGDDRPELLSLLVAKASDLTF